MGEQATEVTTAIPGPELAGEPDKPVPYRAVLRIPGVRILAASRATSRMAQVTLNYGTMVYLGQAQASQFQISLVSSSSYVAPVVFGLQGGAVADTLPRRIALAFGFGTQAALCILTPIFLGTSIGSLMFLMFLTSLLMQIVMPSLKAAVALVSSPAELATVNAVVAIITSIGSAIGSTMIAPTLINLSGINAVLYVSGGLFAIGAIRSLGIRVDHPRAGSASLRSIEWKTGAISIRAHADWIFGHRPISTMILTGAIVVALFESFNTLIPVYVRDVLGANPANAVYIFAPAGLGFMVATVLGPWIILRYGERRLAIVSLACMSIGMMLFGMIHRVAPFFAIFSPLRIMELWGVHLSDELLAVSVIAIPTNFGSTSAGTAVDNFVNRRVPVEHQGATFGLKEVQDNGLTVFTIIVLGGISSLVGPLVVMVVAPIVVTLAVLLLLRYSFERGGEPLISRRDAFRLLLTDASELPAER